MQLGRATYNFTILLYPALLLGILGSSLRLGGCRLCAYASFFLFLVMLAAQNQMKQTAFKPTLKNEIFGFKI